jgi:drug/metabolite transporter (DMT)-like permease
MNSTVKKGAYLALITALISGVSVYVNSFGVREVPDPFVFTTAKNLLVGLVLAALVLAPSAWREALRLTRKQWLLLLALGVVGGSVPFLLFFYGLSQATAASAAFIHKTLFIWVAILAVPLLGEKLGRLQIAALAILVLGNLVLLGPATWAMGTAEMFTLAATVMWAVEAVMARRIMSGVSARLAALGRMGFGSLVMLGFLAFTGRVETLVTLDGIQWGWVVLTSAFLVGYVTCYYGALKRAPATLVASVLVLGSVITSLLQVVFGARTFTAEQVAGFALIVAAAGLWVYIGNRMLAADRLTAPTASPQEVYRAGR